MPQMTQEWPKYGIRSGINVVTTEIIVYPFEFLESESVNIAFQVSLGQKKVQKCQK